MQTSQDLLQNFESGNKAPSMVVLRTSRNNTVPSEPNMADTNYACNKKRIVSSYETLNDLSQGPKKSEDEFPTKSNQHFETNGREGSLNYDISWEESVTNHMTFQRNQLTNIDSDFQTIKEFPSLDQGMQVLGNVGNNTLFTFGQRSDTNTSVSEIFQNDHGHTKVSDSITSNYSKENILTVPGQCSYLGNSNNPYLCSENAFKTIKEPTSLNQGMQLFHDVGKNALFDFKQTVSTNTSISNIAQNEDKPSKISKSVTSNCSAENMLEVPASTIYHWNENNPNFSGDTLQSLHQTEKGKELPCKVCKSKISKHEQKYMENIHYECCICNFNNIDSNYLHFHSYTHVPHKFCNICLKEHTEGDYHYVTRTCTVNKCNETFHCRTRLKEHYVIDHGDYFRTRCWDCCKGFAEHRTKDEGKTLYVCCLCECNTFNLSNWENHTSTHRPKLFCKLCREEHPEEEKGSHQNEFTCIVCKLHFKCKGLFEQHEDHNDYFFTKCRVCDKEIYDHEISDQGGIFKCCKCPKRVLTKCHLSNHLYKHFDFKVYKCDTCEERFKRRYNLHKHSLSCPAVPYKCERCQARFPSRDFLDTHSSLKHSVT